MHTLLIGMQLINRAVENIHIFTAVEQRERVRFRPETRAEHCVIYLLHQILCVLQLLRGVPQLFEREAVACEYDISHFYYPPALPSAAAIRL